MPNPHVKIVTITQFDRYGPGPRVTPMIRVAFEVDQNGPFTVETPADTFRADGAWPQIDAFAEQVLLLHGVKPGA